MTHAQYLQDAQLMLKPQTQLVKLFLYSARLMDLDAFYQLPARITKQKNFAQVYDYTNIL